MAKINLYPTLNRRLSEEIGLYLDQYKFYYDNLSTTIQGDAKREQIELEDNVSANVIVIKDRFNSWDVNFDNLLINCKIEIDFPSKLFGPNGLCPKEATLGIAVRWYSRESKQRGTTKNFIFNNNQEKVSEQCFVKFNKGQLRGSVSIEIILYIEESSIKVSQDELHLANRKGIILGNIDSTRLILEGSASSFPVQSVSNGDGPLWQLKTSWVDLYDTFNESVYLEFNEDHKDYKYLEVKKKNIFNPQLLDEIMISVVVQLVQIVKDDLGIEAVLENEYYPHGTVGDLIKYYINVYKLDYSNANSLYATASKGVRG